MTITLRVAKQFFNEEQQSKAPNVIRIEQSQAPPKPTRRSGTPWTSEEHDRFLYALEKYPAGPWKLIAAHVGSRSTRQTMTHAQKYREKIARRKRNPSLKTSTSTQQRQRKQTPNTSRHQIELPPYIRMQTEFLTEPVDYKETPYATGPTYEWNIQEDSLVSLLTEFEPLVAPPRENPCSVSGPAALPPQQNEHSEAELWDAIANTFFGTNPIR